MIIIIITMSSITRWPEQFKNSETVLIREPTAVSKRGFQVYSRSVFSSVSSSMADLFSMTAPLLLVFPGGEKQLVAEKFAHPEGMVFFDPYWLESERPAVHVLKGELRGEGPWKIGDVVVRVLSCGDTEESIQWSMWQQHLAVTPGQYHDETFMQDLARRYGASV